MKAKIRFYYLVSDVQPEFVSKKGLTRGTIWVWCPNCLHWTHASGINFPKNVVYINDLNKSELQRIKGFYMIDSLNRLWEKGRLSESFVVSPVGWVEE